MDNRENLVDLLYELGVPFAESLLNSLEARGYIIQKWIPAEELPQSRVRVLTLDQDGFSYEGMYDSLTENWYRDMSVVCPGYITHWMPMPGEVEDE